MSTAIAPTARTTEIDGDQCVVLWNIGWKGYTTLLKVRGERSDPRMVYLDGSLLLLSPSYFHERLKKLLGCFIMILIEELEIPCLMAGSTTFRRRAKRGGVEGDETYYLANLDRIRGKKKISLKIDPPPDLAIEVVASHDPDDALEVYRRFRVPEVWICDENQLTILVLQPDGQYVHSERGHAFSFLTASEIHSWISRGQDSNDMEWIKELRRWIAEVVVPRCHEQKKEPASAPDQIDGPE